ncbi:MAG: hypothetical protein NW208_00780 [Bryobacter sp.]|nr:hypothetical protein [Bryobacter sp.]
MPIEVSGAVASPRPSGPAQGQSSTINAEKRKAVEDFEALLLSDVLKNLRSSMGGSWMGEDAGAGSEAISEMAEQQMVKVLASQDVLGLVRTLGSKL